MIKDEYEYNEEVFQELSDMLVWTNPAIRKDLDDRKKLDMIREKLLKVLP